MGRDNKIYGYIPITTGVTIIPLFPAGLKKYCPFAYISVGSMYIVPFFVLTGLIVAIFLPHKLNNSPLSLIFLFELMIIQLK